MTRVKAATTGTPLLSPSFDTSSSLPLQKYHQNSIPPFQSKFGPPNQKHSHTSTQFSSLSVRLGFLSFFAELQPSDMENDSPPPPPPPPATSLTSEVIGRNASTDSEETQSLLNSQAGESNNTEWTNEKHRLYLKSMEATFVNQLYNNINLLGRYSQREHSSDYKLSRQMRGNTRASSGQQFKVLRSGCWEKINFERQEPRVEKADGSRVLLANPWIRHFRSASRHQVVTSSALQEKAAFEGRAICVKGKMALPSPSANSEQFHAPHLYGHDSVGSDAEMSDQNFVGDNIEGDKANCMCSQKRLKSAVDPTSSNDQVVPFSNFTAIQDVTKNPAYLESERHHGSNL
ncbi:cold-regulated protein 27-like [Cornus florida]|uniref:cold-regulated protein 27-like n=1 Tax=Cornus florida TaxID=4283 RepID=UPI0028A16D54|nr:cold-regulated protein 27-like [Cornus florida]